MLTDTQVQVLAAVNDHLEIHDQVGVGMHGELLPELVTDLELPMGELLQAIADLDELGLVEGIPVEEAAHPIFITRVTARGRQELP